MNSRWTTSPIKRDGQVVSIRPNVAGDLEILKIFGTHGCLTTRDIAALANPPRSYGAVIARINLLKRKPNELIQVHRTQIEQPRLYQWSPQALHLTPKGIAKLQEIGFEPADREPSKHFIHQLTQSQTAASFEVGARHHNLEHVVLDQKPVPVTFSWKGHTYTDHRLTPDGGPIGLGYGNNLYRFVVFETDCASEPLTSSNRDRQAIETKFAAYLTVIENHLFETTWGVPSLNVLFTTTTQTRLNNMRDLLRSMSDRHLSFFRFFLFPTILSGTAQPTQGWAVSETGLSLKET